jgi:hypothetical protein
VINASRNIFKNFRGEKIKYLTGKIKALQTHINREMCICSGILEFKKDYCSRDIGEE